MQTLTRQLRAFGAFWYDFIVGDDWRVAVVVVAAFTATYGLTRSHLNAWWLIPIAVALILPASLWRARRK